MAYFCVIICILQGGERNKWSLHTPAHTSSPLGMYGHREIRKWLRKRSYCAQSFSEHIIRSGHGCVGKQQCCRETPGGAREETGLAFIGVSMGPAVKG